jgi:[ribosomal protein S5]-alanine N-acetyltransferase
VTILETERLILRQLTIDDAEFIFELLNDPSFIQNIGDRNIQTLDDACAYIVKGPAASYAKNGFGLWLVALKETNEPIGMCGLIRRETLEDVDIGYAFLPRFWARGYAVEAARAAKDYAKVEVGLKRLVAIVDPVNEGSIRVLEKLGLRYEKMVRLSADDIDLKLFAIDFE